MTKQNSYNQLGQLKIKLQEIFKWSDRLWTVITLRRRVTWISILYRVALPHGHGFWFFCPNQNPWPRDKAMYRLWSVSISIVHCCPWQLNYIDVNNWESTPWIIGADTGLLLACQPRDLNQYRSGKIFMVTEQDTSKGTKTQLIIVGDHSKYDLNFNLKAFPKN